MNRGDAKTNFLNFAFIKISFTLRTQLHKLTSSTALRLYVLVEDLTTIFKQLSL